MRRARLAQLAAPLLLLLTPGCLTTQLWDWAYESGTDYHKAVAIERVEAGAEGELLIFVRMADGSERREAWRPDPSVVEPRLALRDPDPAHPVVPEATTVDVVHLAGPEPPAVVCVVDPVAEPVDRGGPLGFGAAVLATPVTFVVDVVTFPVQLAIALWILDDWLDWTD